MILGTISSLFIKIFAGAGNLTLVLPGVAASSVVYSLCGLCTAFNVHSLNQFILASVPAILYIFGVIPMDQSLIHPRVAGSIM